jgi:hypothetical protein
MFHAQSVLRRVAGLGSLLLLAGPLEARAELTLTWNAIHDTPGSVGAIDFDCAATDGSYRLVATFTPGEDVPNFTVLEAEVVLGSLVPIPFPGTAPPLQPFWHFEVGGCNEGNLALGAEMPSGGGIRTPWGNTGGQATSYLFYAPDQPAQGRGRVLVTMVRMGSSFPLTAGEEYFAFTLDVTMCGATSCGGCSAEDMGFFLSSALLHSGDGSSPIPVPNSGTAIACVNVHSSGCPIINVRSPEFEAMDPRGAAPAVIASSNGLGLLAVSGTEFLPVPARTHVSPCDIVPTRNATWGALKLRYGVVYQDPK